MKPPSMAGGKFAQRCSCSKRGEGSGGGRVLQQLVGCLNERSNEHRNECAPHDKYVKFLLKLSSICCQFLTTSATNFVLVRVSTRTQRVFPTSAASAAAASPFLLLPLLLLSCSAAAFPLLPFPFLVFFRASPCSSSFSLALAALTDLTQHSSSNSQLSFLALGTARGQARRLLISNF